MAEFDPWADLYDILHQGLPGEAEFYVGHAVRSGGPVLELGCGTGRLALPMALSGVPVVGGDDSEPMLEICRDKRDQLGELPAELELIRADMREIDLGRRFPLVVMAYRTFMHLLTPEDQRRALEVVRQHLEPGGLFLCNMWAGWPSQVVAATGALQLVARHELEDGTVLVHYRASRCDELHQRLDEEHLVHEVDGDGEVLATTALSLLRAWLSLREFGYLARSCGFQVEAVFGDFDCSPPSEQLPEMIWALRP